MGGQLREDPSSAVAVHCSDGCGRTGALLACATLYLGHRTSAAAAVALFSARRFKARGGDGRRRREAPGGLEGGGGGTQWLEEAFEAPLSPGPAQVGGVCAACRDGAESCVLFTADAASCPGGAHSDAVGLEPRRIERESPSAPRSCLHALV